MHNTIAFTLLISLVARVLDITWLFQGIEDFKSITIRNIIIKILGLISIFLFIHSKSDLILYIFIIVFFEFLGQATIWFAAKKYINHFNINITFIRNHIKPIFLLFLPQIAISLYVTMDKTLLGILSSIQNVGLYEQSNKIINILLTIIISLGSIILPRISNLLANGAYKQAQKMHEFAFLIYNIIIFPIIIGFIMISHDFISLFLGSSFQNARYAIYIMIFNIFFIGWTNIMGIQILIPHDKHKEFMISTTIPAIISIILNLLLIPHLGYIGASITSVITEFLVWAIQLFYTKSYLKNLNILQPISKILCASFGMLLVLIILKYLVKLSPVFMIVFSIILGGTTYIYLIFKLKLINIKYLKSNLN